MTHGAKIARWITVTGLAIAAIGTLYGGRAFPSLLAQEPLPTDLALFEQYLDVLRQRVRIPGLSAAIVHHQRIIWERGFGVQDLERRIAARPDTPYRIASLTKTFTSTLLMGCVERGTLILLANSGELSSPFPLGAGDVTRSAFARAFLRMFVD